MRVRQFLRRLGIVIVFGATSCSSAPPAQVDTESHTSLVQTQLGQTLQVIGPKFAPKLRSAVEPIYPKEARDAGTRGRVKLQALIDTSGNVVNTSIIEGLPNGLAEAAAAAVRQWKFEPMIYEGKPIPVLFELYINFKLN